MKRFIWLLLVVATLAFGASMVFAQVMTNMVTAKVAFSFYVGTTKLPAGNYEVYQADDSGLDMVIRDLDTGKAIMVPVVSRAISNNDEKAELVFKKVDHQSYLTKVLPAISDGYVLTSDQEIRTDSAAVVSKGTESGE